MDELREVTAAEPGELLGYDDPSAQPEATGVEKLVLKRGNLFLVANRALRGVARSRLARVRAQAAVSSPSP